MEQLPEVLPTVDPALGTLVHAQLARHGADVLAGTTVRQVSRADPGQDGRLQVTAVTADGTPVIRAADLVLVVAGENALGGTREFAGSLGTQVVKIFSHAAARTGLRDHEATAAGYDPVTVSAEADDHKAYYPGSHRIVMRVTGDRTTGQLLGMQLYGHRHAEIAKRIDIAATAIHHAMTIDAVSDLDLSYTPALGSPWEAVQMGTRAWLRETSRR
ncbi:MAG TPA: hypothetical protein VGG35_20670 [Streptosporangiaceae bacterium]|jgi:pyruvate/2-oxoglutarate dehydrogenase complex dihydrolipoamide dehydrogenase (E3) component